MNIRSEKTSRPFRKKTYTPRVNRYEAASDQDPNRAGNLHTCRLQTGAWVSEVIYHRGRKEYRRLTLNQAKCLKELGRENATLKRLIANLSVEKQWPHVQLIDFAELGFFVSHPKFQVE